MRVCHVSSSGIGLAADPTPREGDNLSLYLQEIGRSPLLSKAEERDLIGRVRAGDEEAKRQFIEANLRLVVSVAKRYSEYCTASVSLEDVISVGNIGLIKAVDRYDPERGTFSNHAYYSDKPSRVPWSIKAVLFVSRSIFGPCLLA